MKAQIQFTTIDLIPAKFGNDIRISKVKLLDMNGKYLKFAKLNNDLIKLLKNITIEIDIPEVIEL